MRQTAWRRTRTRESPGLLGVLSQTAAVCCDCVITGHQSSQWDVMPQLWEPSGGCRHPACPLLQSSSCLSPVPFVVCLSPWFPTPSFCPLLTSLLCCQQHLQLFLLTRYALQRCVGSGEESEKKKKKKFEYC